MMKRLLLCAAFLLAAAAEAQSPQTAAPQNPTVPMAPPGASRTPPERIAPSGGTTLSDQLSKGQGTVTPPNVDPNMTVKPSAGAGSAMPVIPPPGSPGGTPGVTPK